MQIETKWKRMPVFHIPARLSLLAFVFSKILENEVLTRLSL